MGTCKLQQLSNMSSVTSAWAQEACDAWYKQAHKLDNNIRAEVAIL